MSEFKWQLVPVEPTEEMLIAGYATVHPDQLLVSAYQAMLAAAPQPPAHELLASLERFDSDGEDFVKLHDVHDVVAMIKQPPALGGEPEVVAEVVNKYGEPAPFAQRDLLHRTDIDKLKIGTELVDRAHVFRLQAEALALKSHADDVIESRELDCRLLRGERDQLQAEVERLKTYSKKLAELDDSTIKRLGDRLRVSEARTAELEGALSGLLFEFDDGVNGGRDEPVPVLDHARTLIAAAEFKPAEGAKS